MLARARSKLSPFSSRRSLYPFIAPNPFSPCRFSLYRCARFITGLSCWLAPRSNVHLNNLPTSATLLKKVNTLLVFHMIYKHSSFYFTFSSIGPLHVSHSTVICIVQHSNLKFKHGGEWSAYTDILINFDKSPAAVIKITIIW